MTDSRPPPGSADLGAQLAELRRLRRPREGRKIAGVCAAVGRGLKIDPVVLRVVVAVMAFFGGTGLLLYAAGWLLIPNEGDQDSVIEQQLGRRPNGSPDKAVLIGGVVVLLLLAMSLPWWASSWNHGVLLLLAVVGLFALVRRQLTEGGNRTTAPSEPSEPSEPSGPSGPSGPSEPSGTATAESAEPHTEPPTAPVETPSASDEQPTQPVRTEPVRTEPVRTEPVRTEPTTTQPTTEPTTEVPVSSSWREVPPAPPGFWDQPDPLGLAAGSERDPLAPAAPLPPPPPPVPRTRSKLFVVTMGCALIVLGVLTAFDLGDHDVPAAGYVAAALGVVGLGLVTGAWIGRSPGLAITGVMLTGLLVPTTIYDYAMDGAVIHERPITVRPTTFEAADRAYEYDAGKVTLDLRDAPFGDKRTAEVVVRLGAGDLVVIVPPRLDVEASGEVDLGQLRMFGSHAGGAGTSRYVDDKDTDGDGGGRLRLTAGVGVGSLEVRRG